MQSQVVSAPIQDVEMMTPIMNDRKSYRSCHIQVPDSPQSLAAIDIQGTFYSFFRTEKDAQRALEVSTRLRHRGDTPIITKTPKGYAIWTLEPQAKPVASRRLNPALNTKALNPEAPGSEFFYKILTSRQHYQPCHIQVPDLEQRLAAIQFEGKYYSLFKTVDDTQQVVQLIRRLSYRGDETVITKTSKGYAVWIFEPDTILSTL